MNKLILLSTILIALLSCNSIKNSEHTPKHHYFSGSYTLQSDTTNSNSAEFNDCATSVRYVVSNTKISRRIMRSYLMLTATPKQPIFVEFRGKIVLDSITRSNIVEIDSLIGFNVERTCTEGELITGHYEFTSEGGERSILRLNSNYTYTQNTFPHNSSEVSNRGVWFRSAELELVLRPESTDAESLYFEIIPAQNSLTESGGDKPLAYKKVYL